MADDVIDELTTLLEQLDEVLADPILDADDALEVAILAGLCERLGGRSEAIDAAREWRDDNGADLIAELWNEFDDGELIAGVEEVLVGDADEDDVEEAILDVDEHIVAAIWCRRSDAVVSLAKSIDSTVRTVPDPFAQLADVGLDFARMPGIARERELYAFWFAIADSGKWATN